MTVTIGLDEIPGPRGVPLLGNVFDIDTASPFESLLRLATEYGPIYKLDTPGATRLIVSGPELVDELCDDSRFDKQVSGGLANLRKDSLDTGLFTADTQDPAVAPRAQHPDGAVQPAGDARLHAEDARHRRAAGRQVGPAQPR
jgi:cytochrome P450 / NADPH-cytochrome P450 reductase